MSIEAMKQALEALEYPGPSWPDGRERAAQALRTAIEQSEKQEPMALEAVYETIIHWDEGGGKRSRRELARRIVALYTAPQPEQEPVGDEWTPCMKLPVVVHVRKQRPGEAHVSTREGITPVKPDDLIMRGVSGEEYPIGRAIFEQTYSLNTTPPQRKPLTEDQIDDIWNRYCDEMGEASINDAYDIARAIEAAHGIKDGK